MHFNTKDTKALMAFPALVALSLRSATPRRLRRGDVKNEVVWLRFVFASLSYAAAPAAVLRSLRVVVRLEARTTASA